MSRMREKLARAFGTAAGPGPQEATGAASELREGLRRRLRAAGPLAQDVVTPPGAELVNAAGTCWVHRCVHAPEERHGNRSFAEVRAGDGDLFLDVETTGLAGGAGTVVFLTGLAWFEGAQLVLEQVFLRSFAEEAAALTHVASRVARARRLVTFVGKTFDRHRLAARFAVQRLTTPILTLPHLDLYYVARRVHGATLPDTRLRTVERALLGLERDDDLPGSEAPAAFLRWLRDRSGAVDRVFEHNRLDVLTLVGLLAVFTAEQIAAAALPLRRARSRRFSGAGGGTSGASAASS